MGKRTTVIVGKRAINEMAIPVPAPAEAAAEIDIGSVSKAQRESRRVYARKKKRVSEEERGKSFKKQNFASGANNEDANSGKALVVYEAPAGSELKGSENMDVEDEPRVEITPLALVPLEEPRKQATELRMLHSYSLLITSEFTAEMREMAGGPETARITRAGRRKATEGREVGGVGSGAGGSSGGGEVRMEWVGKEVRKGLGRKGKGKVSTRDVSVAGGSDWETEREKAERERKEADKEREEAGKEREEAEGGREEAEAEAWGKSESKVVLGEVVETAEAVEAEEVVQAEEVERAGAALEAEEAVKAEEAEEAEEVERAVGKDVHYEAPKNAAVEAVVAVEAEEMAEGLGKRPGPEGKMGLQEMGGARKQARELRMLHSSSLLMALGAGGRRRCLRRQQQAAEVARMGGEYLGGDGYEDLDHFFVFEHDKYDREDFVSALAEGSLREYPFPRPVPFPSPFPGDPSPREFPFPFPDVGAGRAASL
ncbi:hypothetical protein CLOP_g2079 [Closterium sp. NIES-67]|nr:hypothetical protein CLOP_g2079 [Closterium sp. NIES-67]